MSSRRLRPRSSSKCYNEEFVEEEVEEKGRSSNKSMAAFSYNILDKLKEERFTKENGMIKHFDNGKELSCQFLQSTGFFTPMVFHSTEGLDMKVPPSRFSVSDVKHLVGGDRTVDVIDSTTQQSLTMSLSQYIDYYQSIERGEGRVAKRTLNVISLEFSHTHLDPLVEAPQVVRDMDWVNKVWPLSLRQEQTDPTNDLRKMMYPKVQKYCLMSVSGCYTDFHLDFGGTSVWYHIHKGEKIFFLIPPTHENYSLFADWQRHGRQECLFFPDIVKDCSVLHLYEGDTLLLPSGWIHGVYTPKQSLVFGGNFLLSLHITQQLTVAYMEKELRVQGKFRYPFYGSLHWYVIEKYHHSLTQLGVSSTHSTSSSGTTPLPGRWLVSVKLKKLPFGDIRQPLKEACPYMTPNEREGLMLLVKKMKEDSLFSGDIPTSITNPHMLLESLYNQLMNPSLHAICNTRPNGISLLDDNKWAGLNEECKDEVAMETNSDDHVTFDDDFLSGDLLSNVLQRKTTPPSDSSDHTPEQPVLQVTHDHSYGQFITQPNSSPFESNHTLPLIAESPKHLLLPDYPLITPNPTHALTTPTNLLINETKVSSKSLTAPTLPPLSFSLLSRQQEVATPLTPPPSYVTLPSPSPSPTFTNLITLPTLKATPTLKTPPINALQTTPVSLNTLLNQKTSSHEAPPSKLPLINNNNNNTKKRRKPSKDSAKPLRKVRCGQCKECLQDPCGVCKFCLDSPKYGGTGKLRKACVHRRCSNMQLSKTSSNSVLSPLATQTSPPSFSCEQRLADSTTTLGEDPLPYRQGGTSLATKDRSPPIKTEREETTVMAMGYAIGGGANDNMGGADIDLTDILTDANDMFNNTGNMISSSTCSAANNNNSETQLQLMHDTANNDPLLSLQSFLSSPTLQSPFPSLNLLIGGGGILNNSSSPLLDSDFQLHLSDIETDFNKS